MQPGDQVAFIPHHAYGDIYHPDVEFGFVTSVKGQLVWCRFWYKGKPGELRTRANSEGVNIRDLRLYDSVSHETLEAFAKEYKVEC